MPERTGACWDASRRYSFGYLRVCTWIKAVAVAQRLNSVICCTGGTLEENLALDEAFLRDLCGQLVGRLQCLRRRLLQLFHFSRLCVNSKLAYFGTHTCSQ